MVKIVLPRADVSLGRRRQTPEPFALIFNEVSFIGVSVLKIQFSLPVGQSVAPLSFVVRSVRPLDYTVALWLLGDPIHVPCIRALVSPFSLLNVGKVKLFDHFFEFQILFLRP